MKDIFDDDILEGVVLGCEEGPDCDIFDGTAEWWGGEEEDGFIPPYERIDASSYSQQARFRERRKEKEREDQRRVLNMLVRDSMCDRLFCNLLEKKRADLRKYIIERRKGEIPLINDCLFFEERDKRVVIIMKKCVVKTTKGKKYRVIGFDLFTGTVVIIVDTNGLAEGVHGYTQEMQNMQEMSIVMAPFVLSKSDKAKNVFRICGEMEIIGKCAINELRNVYMHDYRWNIMSSFNAVEEFCRERNGIGIAVLVNVKMGRIQKYHNRYQMKLNRIYVNLQDGKNRAYEEAYFHGTALLWINKGMANVLSLYGLEGAKEDVLKDRERIRRNLDEREAKYNQEDFSLAEEERKTAELYNEYFEEKVQEELLEEQNYYYYNPDADEYYAVETGEIYGAGPGIDDDDDLVLGKLLLSKSSEKMFVLENGVLKEQYPIEYDVVCKLRDVWGEQKEEEFSYTRSELCSDYIHERFFFWRMSGFPILNRVDRVAHIMDLLCKINTDFVCGRILLSSFEANDKDDCEFYSVYDELCIGARAKYYDNLYDERGYGLDGYHLLGYDKNGYDREGYDQGGYDREGYNRAGYNFWGYNREGINQYGFDRRGRLENGDEYDEAGYNAKGFNQDGIHRNGTRYDARGYDVNGLDENGSREYSGSSVYGYDGYSKFGYDKKGYNRAGYDRYGRKRGGIKESV